MTVSPPSSTCAGACSNSGNYSSSVPLELRNPTIKCGSVFEFVGVVPHRPKRKDPPQTPENPTEIVTRICALWDLRLPHLQELVGALVETSARNAILREKMTESLRIVEIILNLLQRWNEISLLMQGLYCVRRLLRSGGKSQYRLVLTWFLKPLYAILNDRSGGFPSAVVTETLFLFTQVLDHFLDDGLTVEFAEIIINNVGFQEIAEVLLLFCSYPNPHIRFHAFLTFTAVAEQMGRGVLENQVAVDTLVGYLRHPMIILRVKSMETLCLLYGSKRRSSDSDSDDNTPTNSDFPEIPPKEIGICDMCMQFENATKCFNKFCNFTATARANLPP
ncbi:hypothetical protein HK102_007185, partial [Quaeritorhiza haematococci]